MKRHQGDFGIFQYRLIEQDLPGQHERRNQQHRADRGDDSELGDARNRKPGIDRPEGAQTGPGQRRHGRYREQLERPRVAVLCPSTPLPCKTRETILSEIEDINVVSLSCNFTVFEEDDEDKALERMKSCEVEILNKLVASGNTSALLIDEATSRSMGQAFLNVFKTAPVRKELFDDPRKDWLYRKAGRGGLYV